MRAGSSKGERMHHLSMSIADLCTQYPIDIMAVEKPNSRHHSTLRVLASYASAAAMVAHIHEIEYQEIVRGEAYKLVVGKGNAPKSEGVLYGRRYKPLLNNDDEGDSIVIAMAAHMRGLKVAA